MINPILAANVTDGYKLDHISQYVAGTEMVYSNMTPRDSKLARALREHFDGKVVWFGAQFAVKYMIAMWDTTFFKQPKHKVLKQYARRIHNYVGPDKGAKQIKAMGDLHDLGYLPLRIKALPEGSRVNMQIPALTVQSTHKDFYWLANYKETFLSCMIWPMCNAASLADQYFQTSKRWGEKTGANEMWLGIANHCFAARGHRGMEDAMISGMGQLLSSYGTDTLWAIDGLEEYYNADSDKELIGCSVNATEHATSTQRIAYYRDVLGYKEYGQAEVESVRNLLKEVYPTGILSYVSDSEDFWWFMEHGLRLLADDILARKEDALGLCKFVCRPDSSPKTPLEIILGDKLILKEGVSLNGYHWDDMKSKDLDYAKVGDQYFKRVLKDGVISSFESVDLKDVPAFVRGSLEILGEIFGFETNEKGFKVLNPKVGIIYGEAITLELQDRIYDIMAKDGWCVSNVLFGTGSWGFLENSSRDSYGFAIKGTHSVVDGKDVSMQKSPKTAKSLKKSAKGLLRVDLVDGEYVLKQECTAEEADGGCLEEIFMNGEMTKEISLAEVRKNLGNVG